MTRDTTDPGMKALEQSLKIGVWKNNLFLPKRLHYIYGPDESGTYKMYFSCFEKELFNFSTSFIMVPNVTHVRSIHLCDGTVYMTNIRIPLMISGDLSTAVFLYKLQTITHGESLYLFCDSSGKRLYSNMTKSNVEEVQKILLFFSQDHEIFKPLNNENLSIKAGFRLIGINGSGRVLVRDLFDNGYPANGYDKCIDTWGIKKFVIYDADGHLCRACVDEKSSQIIQKYIEDHEF